MRLILLVLLAILVVSLTARLVKKPPIYRVWESSMFITTDTNFTFRNVSALPKKEWMRVYKDYFDYPHDIVETQFGYCDFDDNNIIADEEIECF
jgi:hypothetical protein